MAVMATAEGLSFVRTPQGSLFSRVLSAGDPNRATLMRRTSSTRCLLALASSAIGSIRT